MAHVDEENARLIAYQKCVDQINKLKQYLKSFATTTTILKQTANECKQRNALCEYVHPFRCQKQFTGHFAKVYHVVWGKHDDNNSLLSVSRDGTLRIWNVETCNQILSIPLVSSWARTCDYAPSGTHVASGGGDNAVSVFNVTHQSDNVLLVHELQQHEGYVSSIQYIDDHQLLSGSGDSTILLWDVTKNKPIQSFEEHIGDISSIDVNVSNSLFISASIDSNVHLYDYRMAKGRSLIFQFRGHTSDVNSVKWFPDQTAFVSGSDDGSIRLWDIKCLQQLNQYNRNTTSSVTSVACSKS
eukprot:370942_1